MSQKLEWAFNKDKLTHSKPLFENHDVLNVYQIKIYQHLNFMHTFINNQIPSMFIGLLKRLDHKYPTKCSQSSFNLKSYSLNSTKYSISICEPKLWNDIINKEEKDNQSYSLFQKKIKSKLIKFKMKLINFNETLIILKSINFSAVYC